MLNNISSISKSEIKTQPSGIIQRSNDKSFFLTFHYNSKMAESLFKDQPSYEYEKVLILQMMLINDGFILAECVKLKDLC